MNRNLIDRSGSTNNYVFRENEPFVRGQGAVLEPVSATLNTLDFAYGPERDVGEAIGPNKDIRMIGIGVKDPDKAFPTTMLMSNVITEYREVAGQSRVCGRESNGYASVGISHATYKWIIAKCRDHGYSMGNGSVRV